MGKTTEIIQNQEENIIFDDTKEASYERLSNKHSLTYQPWQGIPTISDI